MAVVIVIAIAIGLLILLIYCLFGLWHAHVVKNKFKECNVIVSGKKGTGKDLLFQLIISKRKRENYYANIDYGYKYHHIGLKDISVEPNTYLNFIDDDVKKIKKLHDDKEDIYISDGGIYLPSQYDSILYKKFPAVHYAIHLALSNDYNGVTQPYFYPETFFVEHSYNYISEQTLLDITSVEIIDLNN